MKKESKGVKLLKHMRDNNISMKYGEMQQYFYDLNHPGSGKKCSRGYFCDYMPLVYPWLNHEKRTKLYSINKYGLKLLQLKNPNLSSGNRQFWNVEDCHREYNKSILKLIETNKKVTSDYYSEVLKSRKREESLFGMFAINPVKEEEINQAIEYLFVGGFLNEMTSDKKYYTTALLKLAGNVRNEKLIMEGEINE